MKFCPFRHHRTENTIKTQKEKKKTTGENIMEKKQYKKIVLAYSGGLDTSVLIPWLKENYGAEIIAVSGNVGQASELEGLEEKALKTGASKLYIEDLQDEFVNDYILPCIKAGASYEKYLLGTSFARPLIAKRIVEIAKAEGADAICHGCTGKGNDQVRFELAIKAYAPEMDVIAPWRFWELNSREKEIEYAKEHNIPLKISAETNYSKDKNLWHLSHEGLDLEDPANEAPINKEGFLEMGVSPEQAPDTPTVITISFEQGTPVALNGEKMDLTAMIKKLNEIGGANGVGILDIVENRLVGMKSRGVYETPGGTILYAAHEKLEEITLDKETSHYKAQVAAKLGELVYNGQWYTPLRKAISAFVEETQKTVTGDVALKLYKGNILPVSVTSPFSLYNSGMATFDEDDCYNQADSAGFINLYGLPLKVRALNDKYLYEKEGVHFPEVE
jgi:argininosuccinate synthase